MAEQLQRSELVAWAGRLADRATDPKRLTPLNPEASVYNEARIREVGGIPGSELETFGTAAAVYLGFQADGYVNVQTSPRSSASWQSCQLGERIVARTRLRGAEVAIADFETALSQNSASLKGITAIWGLNPQRSVELHGGIVLGPLSEVAPSHPRDILLGIPTRVDWNEEEGGFHVRARPKAALQYDLNLGPVVLNPGGEHVDPEVSHPTRDGELADIARCLTLLVSRSVEAIGSWFQGGQEHPFIGGVGGWSGFAIRWDHQLEVEPEEYDESRIQAVVNGFFALSVEDKTRLRTVLDRFNSSKARAKREDRAVDLGVALEALLFNPADTPSEISLKFKMRGAVLASADPRERKRAFNVLDALYSLRSFAAHGGEWEKRKPALSASLDEATTLAGHLIERVLELKKVPTAWNGLILGWESLS